MVNQVFLTDLRMIGQELIKLRWIVKAYTAPLGSGALPVAIDL